MNDTMPRLLLTIVLLSLAGCRADEPVNPSFALTFDDARRAIEDMQQSPVKLRRPLVIIGGYLDPGIGPRLIDGTILDATGDRRIISISTFADQDFDACRAHVIRAVEEAFPSDDQVWTIEVDVIGQSMGGLVARFAAMEFPHFKRLRIARLFTISSPHRGARRAVALSFDNRHIAMRRGSPFLQHLDAGLNEADYEIIPYTRLDDHIVGEENASPWDAGVWWLSDKPLESSHLFAMNDPRILADILRRLRGEAHYTTTPASPLPAKDSTRSAR
ncbi:MAG: hypothetical protein WD768_01300 [Phycisphaeraceae bacterium]